MIEIKWSFWKVGEYTEEGNGIELSDSGKAHLRFMVYIYLIVYLSTYFYPHTGTCSLIFRERETETETSM